MSESIDIVTTGMGGFDFPGKFSVQNIQTLLNVGVCGAVRGGWQIGDIVFPSRIRSADACLEVELSSGSGAVLTTVRRPLLYRQDKLAVSGDIVDMECFPQALWAKRNQIPFFCIKVISDTIETEPGPVAHLKELGGVLPLLTESVENFVKNLVEKKQSS